MQDSTYYPKQHSFNHQNKKRHLHDYSDIMKHEPETINMLTAFAPKPVNTKLDVQQKEESIVLLLRQHPITQLKRIAIAIASLITYSLINMSGMLSFMPMRFQLALNLGVMLAIIGFILESFLTWFFNVYIITDERIIDVDFVSMIYKNISSAKLDNIEDITTTTGGFLASIVNYGTIKIQTAGEKREFELDSVPQPSKVAALLNELLLEEEREKIEGRVN